MMDDEEEEENAITYVHFNCYSGAVRLLLLSDPNTSSLAGQLDD